MGGGCSTLKKWTAYNFSPESHFQFEFGISPSRWFGRRDLFIPKRWVGHLSNLSKRVTWTHHPKKVTVIESPGSQTFVFWGFELWPGCVPWPSPPLPKVPLSTLRVVRWKWIRRQSRDIWVSVPWARWWGGNWKIFWHFYLEISGKMIQFDEHIFQMGWFNHQSAWELKLWLGWPPPPRRWKETPQKTLRHSKAAFKKGPFWEHHWW